MVSLNLNLLETNVINLSVVIGFLIYVGGDLLRSILEARKESVFKRLKDLQDDVEKSLAAQLNAAEEWELAKKEAFELKIAARINWIAILASFKVTYINEKERLEIAHKKTLQLEEKKILKRLYNECSRLALLEARSKVSQSLNNQRAQHTLIGRSIKVLSKTKFNRLENW